MTEQNKELIAIGASVAAHCHPCLKYHYGKARELDIDVTDINAAIDVGHQVSRGAAKATRDFQETLIPQGSAAEAAEDSCCEATSSEGKCC